jgi:CRP/FNR family cyclic AMP-dependent transcriptional regulator
MRTVTRPPPATEEAQMDLIAILKRVELFEGLSPKQLEAVAKICHERRFSSGELVTAQGDPADELFIVCEGFVEIVLDSASQAGAPRTVVSLGPGQIVGEMGLVDYGPRSANVRANSDPTVVQVIQRTDFEALCDRDNQLGYTVMRNMAADLSFKLRRTNYAER